MERLNSIIGSLKSGEIRLIRAFYRSKLTLAYFDKREKLFMLILAKPNCSEKEAIRNLFAKKNPKAFNQIKKRLKADILNLLLLQEADIKYKSKYAQAVFNCRRAIIQGELLLSRGVYDEAIDILLKAAELSRHNELYAEQIMIHDIYRTHIVMKQQGYELGDLKKQIDKSILLLEKSSKAKHLHYELFVPGLYRSDVKKPAKEESIVSIAEMKTDFEATGSLRIGFYYHLSAMQFNTLKRDYETSLYHGKELLELVKSSPAFQSDSFIGGANMEIANALINLERYDEALEFSLVALTQFKPGMLNELLTLEKLYYCYIRKNELLKARETIDRAFLNEKMTYNKFLHGKWWYMKAGLEFLKNDYTRAIHSLKNCDSLMKDKSGWLLGYWLLEMMCRIEKGNLEWFELRSESFKKITLRHASGSGEDSNLRMVIIFKILRSFRRIEFDFSELLKIEKDNLDLLEKGKGEYCWDPAGYELIRFDKWVYSKAQEAQLKKSTAKKRTVS
jgi:tetratricopeptide (TPR) repeat protein